MGFGGMAANLGEAILTLNTDALPGISGLNKFRSSLTSIGAEINSMGSKFMIAGGAIKGLTTMVAGKGISTLSQIEKASHEARLIAGETVENWKPVDALIEHLGMTTINTQVQIAAAVRTIAQAGYSSAGQLEPLVKSAQNLGMALGTDTQKASGVLISAMESFKGMGVKGSADQLERITNLLGNVAAASRIEFGDLQDFVQQLAGMANIENANPTELLTAFGAINQVMGNGAMAATGLRQGWDMLLRITSRTDFTKEILPQLEAVGMTADDINPRIHGLNKAVQNLNKTGLIMNPKATMWFGVQGKNALALLANGKPIIDNITAGMSKMGSVAERAKQTTETLWGRGMLLLSLMEQLWKKIGEGVLEAGVDKMFKDLTTTLQTFVKWVTNNTKTVGQIILAFGALGGVLLAIGIALKIVGTSVAFVTSLFSFGGVAWVAVLALVWQWWLKNSQAVSNFRDALKRAFEKISTGNITGAWKEVTDSITANFPALAAFADYIGSIKQAITTMWARGQVGQDLIQEDDKKQSPEDDKNPFLSDLAIIKEKWTKFSAWILEKYEKIKASFNSLWTFVTDPTLDWREKVTATCEFISKKILDTFYTIIAKITNDTPMWLELGAKIGEAVGAGIGSAVGSWLSETFGIGLNKQEKDAKLTQRQRFLNEEVSRRGSGIDRSLAPVGYMNPQVLKDEQDERYKAFQEKEANAKKPTEGSQDHMYGEAIKNLRSSIDIIKSVYPEFSGKNAPSDVQDAGVLSKLSYARMRIQGSSGQKINDKQLEGFIKAQYVDKSIPEGSKVLGVGSNNEMVNKFDSLDVKVKATAVQVKGSDLWILLEPQVQAAVSALSQGLPPKSFNSNLTRAPVRTGR